MNLKSKILDNVKKRGGWVNAHAHIDRSFTLSNDNLKYVYRPLQEKWLLNDKLKRESTVDRIYDRMAFTTEKMIKQGVRVLGSFIDIDEVIEDKAIKAAQRLRDHYKKSIKIIFINQVLQGVIDKKAYSWFKIGSEFVDIIGGLPGKDKGKEEKHLEIILAAGKEMKKMVHVHVDQLNTAAEKESELLAKKTIEAKMCDRVVAIHGISLAAHKKQYRKRIYRLMKKAGITVIACPTAWIDSRRSEISSTTHNAVTPIDEMIPEGITVAIGTDNIVDIYKPFTDGDMWTELRFILESCHYYEINKLVDMATVNGLKVLGLKDGYSN
ncbi:amidohydrolase family protein [Candidatus Roizmanbacteria bacterium]|nr:amidohydrolase family protein [Candidatus Roizmanbacteria bacterium]